MLLCRDTSRILNTEAPRRRARRVRRVRGGRRAAPGGDYCRPAGRAGEVIARSRGLAGFWPAGLNSTSGNRRYRYERRACANLGRTDVPARAANPARESDPVDRRRPRGPPSRPEDRRRRDHAGHRDRAATRPSRHPTAAPPPDRAAHPSRQTEPPDRAAGRHPMPKAAARGPAQGRAPRAGPEHHGPETKSDSGRRSALLSLHPDYGRQAALRAQMGA
jgi:hypothetical protein